MSSGNNIFRQLQDNVTESEMQNIPTTSNHQATSKAKPPPITIFGLQIVSLKAKLSKIKNFDSTTLHIKITQHGIQVHTKDTNQYSILYTYCKDNKIQFHTHTLRDHRKIKICLYGLWRMDLNDLVVELKRLGIAPADIKTIEIKRKRYDEQCIYLLYFLKKDNIKVANLRQTRAVFNCIVRWDYYSPKIRGPTQCSTCQDFGHGAENCFRKPKCIRCSEEHESSKCPHLPLPQLDEMGNELPNFVLKIPVAKVKCAIVTKITQQTSKAVQLDKTI